MKTKPKFRVGQVVAHKNLHIGHESKYFEVFQLTFVAYWYYKTEHEAGNGAWGTLEEDLRCLTAREIGPRPKRGGNGK